MKTITTEVYGGGFNGLEFSAATMTLDQAMIDRIVQLAAECTRLDVQYIEIHDDRVIPMAEESDEVEGSPLIEHPARLECVYLKISPRDFLWSGCLKHSDESFETEAVQVATLIELADGDHDLRD